MNSTGPAIQELARRLIALEAPYDARPVTGGSGADRACEKLRVSLTKLTGTAGYYSLILRAMSITKAQAPALASVQVQLDGSLQGFDEIGQVDAEAGLAVLAHLLSLLVTFIGEPLTQSLVRDAWPGATLDKSDLSAEE